MKILFVADVSIAKVIGGAERVLFEQSARLAARRHKVHILTRRLPEHKQNQDIIQGVPEWRYDVYQKSTVSLFRTTRKNARQLFESLHNQYHFDAINFHQPFSAYGVIQSRRSKKIKKIYTCHSLSFEEFISRNVKPEGFIKNALYLLNIQARKLIEKKVLKNSDAIVTLSRFTQEKLGRAYKIPFQKVSIIPGGVDLKKFHPPADKMKIRRQLHIPVEKIILFSVRNLVPRMGLENLIHAIKIVVRTAPDIYLVVGGEGPLRDELISLTERLGIESFVKFIGYLPEEKLPDYYRMADLFVLPTRELEGFGLVIIGSMASGVPVLGTPVGGIEEILGSFDQNFIFKDTTPDSMADLIVENYHMIKEKTRVWEVISQRCRNFVEENYSWERNVEALEKIFF